MSASSRLQRAVVRFLAHKRALGHAYRGEAGVLSRLGRFIRRDGSSDLGASGFSGWLHSLRDRHANTRRKSHQIVRNFCLYRRRGEPRCFVPSDDFAKRQPHITPVIVEPSQVARMLALAAKMKPAPNSPVK